MSYTDLQTNLCPMGSITRQPYDESQNPTNIPSLKLTSTVSLGNAVQCQQSGPIDSPEGSEDLKRKRTHLQDIARAAAIQGVRQYLVDGNEQYQIPVCGSPDGNPFQATPRCSFPVTET